MMDKPEASDTPALVFRLLLDAYHLCRLNAINSLDVPGDDWRRVRTAELARLDRDYRSWWARYRAAVPRVDGEAARLARIERAARQLDGALAEFDPFHPDAVADGAQALHDALHQRAAP